MTPTTLQVYFVRPVGMRGPIKIGCSKLPENRVKSLMAWSPFELEIAVAIPGNFKLEKAIHECFADAYWRLEWFHPVQSLLTAVDALIAGVPVEQAFDFSTRKPLPKSAAQLAMHSPARRKYMGYMLRVHRAEQRATKGAGRGDDYRHGIFAPRDVKDIMRKWNFRAGIEPTAAEFARLHEFCADPLKHGVTREDRQATSPAPSAELPSSSKAPA